MSIPFGSVVSYALLHQLDKEVFLNAMGLAASMSSGIRSNFGTMSKAYHAGLAARNGVIAAELAQHGITSSLHAMEKEDGFFQCFGNIKDSSFQLELGKTWDLVNPGLAVKKYPCCSGTHPAIDAMLDLLEKKALIPSAIRKISVGTTLLSPHELIYPSPINAAQAKFSMQYAIAATLLYGKVTLNEFQDDKIVAEDAQRLMSKIKTFIDPELEKLGFVGTSPIKIKIDLIDGQVVQIENDLAKGNPGKPLSISTHKKKFLSCSTRCFSQELSEKIWEHILCFEQTEDIHFLIQCLTPITKVASHGELNI